MPGNSVKNSLPIPLRTLKEKKKKGRTEFSVSQIRKNVTLLWIYIDTLNYSSSCFASHEYVECLHTWVTLSEILIQRHSYNRFNSMVHPLFQFCNPKFFSTFNTNYCTETNFIFQIPTSVIFVLFISYLAIIKLPEKTKPKVARKQKLQEKFLLFVAQWQ